MDESRLLTLDGTNTKVAFDVGWLAGFTVRGHFTEVHGTLVMPDDEIEHAELAVDVAADSVCTGIGLRDRHLCGSGFLDASRTPFISFRSTGVGHASRAIDVDGMISLRGVQRPLSVRCPVSWGGGNGMSGTVTLGAEFVVRRLDHEIGAARGLHALNPLFLVIGRDVRVRVELVVPATQLLPLLLPALGR